MQRRYLAEAAGSVFDGFAEVEYPDWRALLRALARAAAAKAWRGPLVLDEFPYLSAASPALASVLQAFVDHEARQAGLVIVLAGSSQHLMQGLALDRSSPLYGRAAEALEVQPLPAGFIAEALGLERATESVMAWAVWGAASLESALDAVVLDPAGPLHREPDRLLAEELPPAVSLRPLPTWSSRPWSAGWLPRASRRSDGPATSASFESCSFPRWSPEREEGGRRTGPFAT